MIDKIRGERFHVISGNNDFPPLFDPLKKMFMKYLHEEAAVETDPEKRDMYIYMLGGSIDTLRAIRERFEKVDTEAGPKR